MHLGRRSHLVLAAPSCHRLLYRVDGPGSGLPGGYDRRRRGDSFGLDAGRVLARGDRHAGPVSTYTSVVSPLGPRLSVYEVRTTLRRTRIRVVKGSVGIRTVRGRSRLILRAGFETVVRCSRRSCAVDLPRRFR
jgi:hypothetical protein